MIAELFYPKELKKVIADLRAKDDLNEEALKSLNGYIIKRFFIVSLVSCFIFIPSIYLSESMAVKSVCVFLLMFMVFYLVNEIVSILKKFPVVFSSGVDATARVSQFSVYGMVNSTWQLFYEYEIGAKKYKCNTGRISSWFDCKHYKQHDLIDIYYISNAPHYSAPAIPSLVKIFKLNKKS